MKKAHPTCHRIAGQDFHLAQFLDATWQIDVLDDHELACVTVLGQVFEEKSP